MDYEGFFARDELCDGPTYKSSWRRVDSLYGGVVLLPRVAVVVARLDDCTAEKTDEGEGEGGLRAPARHSVLCAPPPHQPPTI